MTTKQPTVYLAGPMRGYEEFNFPAFDGYQLLLEKEGFKVISPANMDREIGFDESTSQLGDFSVEDAMLRDVAAITTVCDAGVVLMPGWSKSTGANFEKLVAERTGRFVQYILGPSSGPITLTTTPTEIEPPGRAGHPRFHELVKEIGDLHDKKQRDYGTANDPFANVRGSEQWGIPAWVGAMVRANDKIKRLQNFAQKGELANESAEDSFRDLAVYALIALVLYEESSAVHS